MNIVHIVIGWGIALSAIATLVVAFLPNAKDETFDNLSGITVGLLIIQVVVGFFMFTAADSTLNFFHMALPVAGGAALMGARAMKGDRRKQLVALAAVFVLAAGVFAYITGLQAVSNAG
jgi:fucose 4-O-acetylase-like acetyltransferase